jgi:hypothetical protein
MPRLDPAATQTKICPRCAETSRIEARARWK